MMPFTTTWNPQHHKNEGNSTCADLILCFQGTRDKIGSVDPPKLDSNVAPRSADEVDAILAALAKRRLDEIELDYLKALKLGFQSYGVITKVANDWAIYYIRLYEQRYPGVVMVSSFLLTTHSQVYALSVCSNIPTQTNYNNNVDTPRNKRQSLHTTQRRLQAIRLGMEHFYLLHYHQERQCTKLWV